MKSNINIFSRQKYALILGHIGAILTVIAWGSSFLSTKILMEEGGFTPVEMYCYRFTAAYVLLLFFTLKKFFANSWRDELNFLLCGICAGSLYFITENYALKFTTAGNVSLLASISPIFTTILMAVVFGQRIKLGVITGSIIAFLGAACIIFSHGESLEIKPAGDLLALSAALSWAVYTIAVKRLIPYYSTLFITRKLFFYGVITALPVLFLQKEPYHLHLLFDFQHPTFFFNFMFLVLMCSLGAYLMWNEVMKTLGPVASNNYLYAQPMVTMIGAYFLLNELIYPLGYVGCALIISGLVISDKWKSGIRFHRK